MATLSKEQAETKVLDLYKKLHKTLMELTDAMQYMEPEGIFIDQPQFTHLKNGKIRVGYKARPVAMTVIDDSGREFALRYGEIIKSKKPKE